MKVCFVGVGSIGKRHIRNCVEIFEQKNIELQIHVLRSSDKELDNDVENVIKKTVFRAEELDEKYDAIFITNPTYKHYETMKDLIDKADCFFIEKPVFDTVEKDVSCFSKKNKKYYVACPLRYTNVLIETKKIVENEKVLSVRAISSSYLPEWREGVDYRKTYSANKEQGGGVRIDLIHEWDYLNFLFGAPLQIFSLSGKYSDLEISSEDLAVYIGEYADKLVELHLDYFGRKTRRCLELRTSEHEYICDIVKSRILKDGIVIKEFKEEVNDRYIKEMLFFWDIVYGNKDTTNDLLQAINVMKLANKR